MLPRPVALIVMQFSPLLLQYRMKGKKRDPQETTLGKIETIKDHFGSVLDMAKP